MSEGFSTRITFITYLSIMNCLGVLLQILWWNKGFSTRNTFEISLTLVNCFDVKNAQSLTQVIALHQVESKHDRAIIFYPNSGEEWDAANESWLEGSGCTDGAEFSDYMMGAIHSIQSVYKRKKNKYCSIIVGGCCRTSPSTIHHLRVNIDKQKHLL